MDRFVFPTASIAHQMVRQDATAARHKPVQTTNGLVAQHALRIGFAAAEAVQRVEQELMFMTILVKPMTTITADHIILRVQVHVVDSRVM